MLNSLSVPSVDPKCWSKSFDENFKKKSYVPVLASLHRLPVKSRIELNIVPLTSKSFNSSASSCIRDLIAPSAPGNLRCINKLNWIIDTSTLNKKTLAEKMEQRKQTAKPKGGTEKLTGPCQLVVTITIQCHLVVVCDHESVWSSQKQPPTPS